MPGFYPDGEYDLAGFIVGVVERDKIITGKDVQVGDVFWACPPTACTPMAIRWPASCLFEVARYSPDTYVNEIKNKVATS